MWNREALLDALGLFPSFGPEDGLPVDWSPSGLPFGAASAFSLQSLWASNALITPPHLGALITRVEDRMSSAAHNRVLMISCLKVFGCLSFIASPRQAVGFRPASFTSLGCPHADVLLSTLLRVTQLPIYNCEAARLPIYRDLAEYANLELWH